MIQIRKHERKDIPFRVKWFNNFKVNKYLGDKLGEKTSLKKEKKWFSNYELAKNKKFFTICDKSKPIGLVGISNINPINKTADLFIAIGEDNYHGKGIGKDTMLWIIDYGFNTLKLHKLKLAVIKNNIPAVRLYHSLGFILEGEIKKENYYQGRYYSLLLMAIFNKSKK